MPRKRRHLSKAHIAALQAGHERARLAKKEAEVNKVTVGPVNTHVERMQNSLLTLQAAQVQRSRTYIPRIITRVETKTYFSDGSQAEEVITYNPNQ